MRELEYLDTLIGSYVQINDVWGKLLSYDPEIDYKSSSEVVILLEVIDPLLTADDEAEHWQVLSPVREIIPKKLH